jgi:uncharacterized protein involved in cysteine biosynthesis
MIWTLFYKACRILTFVIIAFLIILALTKFLPVIGSIFTKIGNTISSFFNGIEGFLTSLGE